MFREFRFIFLYKIPTKFLTESSRQHTNCVTPWRHTFEFQQWRLNYIVFCIVFACQDAIIFMSIPVVLGVCLTDSCCSTIWTVIQIEWPAFCASTTLVSILHTFYKKEYGIDMTTTYLMLHLIQQQASSSLGYMLLWLRGRIPRTWRRKVKQCWWLWLFYAIGWWPWQKLIEFAAPLGTWLRVVSHGSLRAKFWILLSLLGEG